VVRGPVGRGRLDGREEIAKVFDEQGEVTEDRGARPPPGSAPDAGDRDPALGAASVPDQVAGHLEAVALDQQGAAAVAAGVLPLPHAAGEVPGVERIGGSSSVPALEPSIPRVR